LKKISGFFRETLKRIQKNKPEYAILHLTKQNMFMQNLSSLVSTQPDLDTFLTIFEENSKIFQENSLANSKKNPNLGMQLTTKSSKAFSCKISAAYTQTDLDKFLTFFKKNSRFS
jgi:hypothetical protein